MPWRMARDDGVASFIRTTTMAKSHKTSRQYVPRVVNIAEGPGGFEADYLDLYASEPEFVGVSPYGAPFRVMREAVQLDALER